MDIEGAEEAVFQGASTEWMAALQAIAVELHTATARALFEQVMATSGFTWHHYDEVRLATPR